MTSLRYLAVDWRHDHADEPVRLFSEVDLEGWEKRKVEEFRSGRKVRADTTTRSGSTRLGEDVIPSIDEIAKDPQFSPREIAKDEFERVWLEATPS
jgi:hypothetical protein